MGIITIWTAKYINWYMENHNIVAIFYCNMYMLVMIKFQYIMQPLFLGLVFKGRSLDFRMKYKYVQWLKERALCWAAVCSALQFCKCIMGVAPP